MASFSEQRGGTYTQVGDVFLPDLVPDPAPKCSLGRFGRMRKRYLEQRRDGTFTALALSGDLTQHLLDTDRAATDLFDTLVRQLAQAEGVTESLKARDQMEWLRRMNNIRNRAEEIVTNELIYN